MILMTYHLQLRGFRIGARNGDLEAFGLRVGRIKGFWGVACSFGLGSRASAQVSLEFRV